MWFLKIFNWSKNFLVQWCLDGNFLKFLGPLQKWEKILLKFQSPKLELEL